MNPSHTTALITGAGRRIGAACAKRVAQHGTAVVIHYGTSHSEAKELQEEITNQGGEAHILQADLTDPEQTMALIPQAMALLNSRPIDILINNAAIFLPGSIQSTPIDLWNRHLAINLTAPFLLMQAFVLALPPQRTGKIIQIIDQYGHRPRPGYAAYSAAKSALWTLTRQAALELAPRIQVNAIGPGPILPASGDSMKKFAQIAAATPSQRAGTLDDITAALFFLLHNDFITGEMIRVDGGEHLR
ncbi:MAG: SDR family oxidoreductase [Magnetococcales bacterium]|nr:SDR family oxidoreductase [Magnetococcales bacterium]MBF0438067.1 SDR family oxidoreductase [Magnetococcales bacterium]